MKIIACNPWTKKILKKIKKDLTPIVNKYKIRVEKLIESHRGAIRGANRNKGQFIAIKAEDPINGNLREYKENLKTAVHELGHSLCSEVGHGTKFKEIYKMLEKEVEKRLKEKKEENYLEPQEGSDYGTHE